MIKPLLRTPRISLFPRHRFSATKAAASTRKMPSKRVSLSPASVNDLVNDLKRQFSSDATDLQCLICQELVVDAVQVVCCGALHCRACISKCDKCPQCRKHVNADCIVPDVRCERLAAACSRPCPNAQHGCDFNGNRASVTAHEDNCDFVPRSVLRGKIQAVELQIRAQVFLFNVARSTSTATDAGR
jgi:hypothetical protein